MNLFPHNKEAYDSAVSLFKREKRVCIIRPTGTGKSVIIAAFVNQHPSKRHLLLAPGSHIFNEIQKHIRRGEISSSTYIGLKLKKSLFIRNSFDYIYLDEFHRLGAEVWGGAVERLLELNPNANVLGTSATPIRYLDDGRDMASEIFKGCIATQMSLNSAIAGGILPTPIYVSALYSIREEFVHLKNKIQSSAVKDKEKLVNDLDSKVIDWERSSGLDVVLKKRLGAERRRVIVFCKDWVHLKYAQKILNPILKSIYGKVESLALYSKKSVSENDRALKLFTGEDPRAVILYTIDKVNEGLHSKNCNTVILLRDTISPIVFYQQIGRAFSIKVANRPLIIDLVNNFKNVQLESFKSDFEHELTASARGERLDGNKKALAAIEFIDETQDIREIFSSFDEEVDRWKLFYKKADNYFKAHGHLSVPAANKDLYHWIANQKKLFLLGRMSKARIELFKAIGIDFSAKIPPKWMMMLDKLVVWIKEKSELPTITQDKKLATWIVRQRKVFGQGKLMKEQIDILARLFPLEGDRTQLKIRARIDRLAGHFCAGTIDTTNEQIRKDLACIKDLYRNNRLSQNTLLELRALHIPVEITMNDFVWLDNVKALIKWCEQNGKLPLNKENSALYLFWKREEKYINRAHSYDKFITIDKDAKKWLERLQAILISSEKWDEPYSRVRKIVEKYGRIDKDNCDKKLLSWIYWQRMALRKGKVSPDRLKKLLKIKEIDWYGHRKRLSKLKTEIPVDTT